jgi:hypothetical protein
VNPIARPLASRRLAKKLYKLVRKTDMVNASAPPPPTPNGGLAGPRVGAPMKQGLADVRLRRKAQPRRPGHHGRYAHTNFQQLGKNIARR